MFKLIREEFTSTIDQADWLDQATREIAKNKVCIMRRINHI